MEKRSDDPRSGPRERRKWLIDRPESGDNMGMFEALASAKRVELA